MIRRRPQLFYKFDALENKAFGDGLDRFDHATAMKMRRELDYRLRIMRDFMKFYLYRLGGQ